MIVETMEATAQSSNAKSNFQVGKRKTVEGSRHFPVIVNYNVYQYGYTAVQV